MAQDINISKDLYDLLVSKNFDPNVSDAQGRETTPDEGSVFKFDYIASSGKNYGTAVILIGDDQDLMLFFGDNLGKSMDDPEDKDEWFQFLQQMSKFSTRHNFHTFTPKNLNAIKHTMAGMAAIKEGLFEGYYGTRKVSYMGERTQARLVINHNRLLGENDKRYRYVESLFIETADGERFRLPFTKLVGGRAMLEHVRQGGKPYDIRATHIAETIQEMSVLARFNRASHNKMFEGQTQQLVEAAREYYHNLQNNLKHISTARGYQTYFESWTPADVGAQEALVEDLKTMFIEQTLDTRIEAALPTLAKIQGNTMKEADQFESWANNLVEGTWALPETPEAKDTLYSLLNQELPVGPDAANAKEQLYDILGDDQLFDRLSDLADRNANADARPVIIARMKEMGMEVPGVKAEPEVNEADPISTFEVMSGFDAPVAEGSCNMTAEGEYCPEHALAECGSMYEMSTVAGSMAPVIGEDDSRDKYYYQRNNIWRVMDGDELVHEYTPDRYEVVGAKKLLAQFDDEGYDVTHVISPMGTVTYLYGKPEDDMDEGKNDDPMNYNAAITSSYYESDELARIKSLALLK
jgi:hypothetical protein